MAKILRNIDWRKVSRKWNYSQRKSSSKCMSKRCYSMIISGDEGSWLLPPPPKAGPDLGTLLFSQEQQMLNFTNWTILPRNWNFQRAKKPWFPRDSLFFPESQRIKVWSGLLAGGQHGQSPFHFSCLQVFLSLHLPSTLIALLPQGARWLALQHPFRTMTWTMEDVC